MRKKRISRIISAVTCLGIVLTSTANAAFWSTYTVSRDIGEGSIYSNVSGQNSSGLQNANYVEYTPNTGVSPIIAYGSGLYGRSDITKIADYLENQGMDVVAGINADFFDLASGIPIGIVINNGVLMSSSMTQYAVGFMADGTAITGKPTVKMAAQGPDGTFYTIDYYNKTRNDVGLCLLDRGFSTTTKINTPGTNIILERVDNTPIQVGGKVTCKVVRTEKTSQSTEIGENQFVLTVSDKGPTARFPSYNPGDLINISITPAERDWKDVVYAVGGKSLIEDGKVTTAGIDAGTSKAPRTAVGVKADGTVVLYEIDGRQSGHSVGLTAAELAQELKDLGVVDAICLDGGGSSSMVIQKPGDDKSAVINKPSDGSLRKCANFIYLVNNEQGTGEATKLHIYPTYQYVLPNATTKLAVKATDDAYKPATVTEQITYTSDVGTVSGDVFTAGSNTGIANITAQTTNGTGSHKIFVTSVIDTMSLTKGGTTVKSLSLKAGETVDLDAIVSYRGNKVSSSDNTINWKVTGDIGTFGQDGIFTAVNYPASGKITAHYEGVETSIDVSVGMSSAQDYIGIATFENGQPFQTDDADIAITADYQNVYSGKNALEIKPNSNTINLVADEKYIEGYPYMTLSAKGNAKITATFIDDEYAEYEQAFTAVGSSNGFTQFVCEVPENVTRFTGLKIEANDTVYLDHVIAHQNKIESTTHPKITLVDAPSKVSVGNTAKVQLTIKSGDNKAAISTKGIAAYVDGKTVTGSYNNQSGAYVVTTPALTQGIHRVTVDVTDLSGVKTRYSVDITAGDAQSSNFVDTSSSWANQYINFVSEKGVIVGETVSGKSYFRPTRNLTRAEFAVIMARYLDLQTTTEVEFADSDKIPSWAKDGINAVYQSGIMTGSSSSGKPVFNPTATITRQEVMTVISKSLDRGYELKNKQFTDSSKIASWATEHVNYLVSLGLVNGTSDGLINPTSNITRAEIAKILYGLY